MAVERDYKPEDFLGGEEDNQETTKSQYQDGINPLLQGKTARSSTTFGKTAVVSEGENIQVALDNIHESGGGTVLLLPGTYILNNSLRVYGGVTLEGASRDNCIIDCNGAHSVDLSGDLIYATGTISATTDSTTVTGSGTTWTDDIIGNYILIEDYYYEITARASATSLTLGEAYFGTTNSGESYVIANPNQNPSLKNVSILNSTTAAIKSNYVVEPYIDDAFATESTIGIEIKYTVYARILSYCYLNDVGIDAEKLHQFKIDYTSFESCTDEGGKFVDCTTGTIIDSATQYNGANGFEFTGCNGFTFISVDFNSNGDNGAEFISNNNDINFTLCSFSDNTNDGLSLTATTDQAIVANSSANDNGGYGINIAASTCDGTILNGISYSGNTSGEYNDGGTDTVIIPDGAGPVVTVYEQADSPATWTKQAGLKMVKVELWGGGGSGGNNSGDAGGGGGGVYTTGTFQASDLGATETVTIGAGGVGVATGNPGNVGGNSSFGSLVTAYGGGGGGHGAGGNNGGGGAGGSWTGVGAVGSTTIGGAPSTVFDNNGKFGYGGDSDGTFPAGSIDAYYSGGGGSGYGNATYSKPGSSHFGGGGGAGTFATNSTGGTSVYGGAGGDVDTAGSVPGGGGGANEGTSTSGAGGAGRVIVTEYY